jgi:hypothetical protein
MGLESAKVPEARPANGETLEQEFLMDESAKDLRNKICCDDLCLVVVVLIFLGAVCIRFLRLRNTALGYATLS